VQSPVTAYRFAAFALCGFALFERTAGSWAVGASVPSGLAPKTRADTPEPAFFSLFESLAIGRDRPTEPLSRTHNTSQRHKAKKKERNKKRKKLHKKYSSPPQNSLRKMTGRGKGGKGLGKGGAKRHRKVLRDNIQARIRSPSSPSSLFKTDSLVLAVSSRPP
jgi:hypothetical protein